MAAKIKNKKNGHTTTIEKGQASLFSESHVPKRSKHAKDEEEGDDVPWPDSGVDDGWFGKGTGTSSYSKGHGGGSGGGWTSKCHEKHPELSLGGGTLVGASCNLPRKGFDLYVGFDWGMKIEVPAPWNPPEVGGPVYGKFLITDGSVPQNKAEFDRMIEYLIAELAAGKKVHIGCIGGHGRTGLVIAVLAKLILGEEDAITWTRTNHCKKAVETKVQVEWLHKHYGIKAVEASKAHSSWGSTSFDGKYGGKGTSTSTSHSHGGGMGMSGKSGGGKALKSHETSFGGGSHSGNALTEGATITALAGPSRVFSPD